MANDEELKEYLKYELAPYPLSIFNELGMRKSQKSLMYKMFTPVVNMELSNYTCVVDVLLPIPLTGPLIPEILLNLISCNCTKGCTASYGCRKHGLKCSTICGYCKGNSCLNAMEAIDEDDIESISDEGNNSKKEADEINVANQIIIIKQ
ncbi:Uncharacterized protein FWK35_00032099 [Aphis craccivora]|uniref:Tesmin/TSO1-like CXC domain-containing protein n=1 Tax=Aphis craccivora TaxID=307492 RepID=A0A6G0VXP5_APHCR|nr:Uncharacterized protein FWK35_00032099 [Aphis craccivora]